MKKTILIFTGQYLPGFKGGGPIKSIANIVEHLGEEFIFKIVTSDRDLGDNKPYENVKVDSWIKVGSAQVIYLSPKNQTIIGIKNIINNIEYDAMYLTGYFSPKFTLIPLILRRFKLIENKKIILAPRGDFSKGALENKKNKKDIFIRMSRRMNLYNDIYWHATTEFEKRDIEKVIKDNQKIYIANNLPKKDLIRYENISEKKKGELSCVFISRISPKKNITYALDVLKDIEGVNIKYDIYGPIEDNQYWEQCLEKINNLPSNIEVNYKGELNPDEVSKVFSKYNSFLFPTMGENFGHAILEALSGGCSLIISNETPWRELEKIKIGFDIDLNDKEKFKNSIERYANLSKEDFDQIVKNVKCYLDRFLIESEDIVLTRYMFNDIFIE